MVPRTLSAGCGRPVAAWCKPVIARLTGNRRLLSCAGVYVVALAFPGFAVAQAAADEPLPEPLTLEYALSLADEPHPELEQAQAGIELAQAERMAAEARTGTRASVRARIHFVEPNTAATDQSNNDHALSFIVRKNLYDFGRTRNRISAAESDIKGRELYYLNERNRRRIEIMRRYFDVLLADLEFLRDNEDMAVKFVRLDRLRDRRELGQVSDLEVLEQENLYQKARLSRYSSQARQRATRARLAAALNRPGKLPSDLAEPPLQSLGRKLPDVEDLQAVARRSNPVLRATRAHLEATVDRIAAARAEDNPVLHGEFEASANSREIGSRDNMRVGVTLEIPLTTGGAADAQVASQRAEMHRLQAELAEAELEVREQVLDLWLELQNLRVQREQVLAQLDFADLDLDRNRTLYALEVTTDLGDSMVRISEAQRRLAEADFEMELIWAQLDALTGRVAGAQYTGEGGETTPSASGTSATDASEAPRRR